MKRVLLSLLSSFLVFSCTPPTQTASQKEVVTVYATSAAQPWLSELYACSEKSPVVLNVNADEPDIYLRVGEPEEIILPVYQIDEEEIWIVTHRESPILNMSLDELQSLFAGQGEPSIQVWVYSSETDVQKVFDQFVMEGRSVTSLAQLAANPQTMLNVLESERQAIGILPLTWSMKMNGSRGIYHVATVPVLAIMQNEPQGVVIDLISCLQSN